MTVIIDDEPLCPDTYGLETVGQLLAHVRRRSNRLVTTVLIDGQEPDPTDMAPLRSSPLKGKTIYIETQEPRQMALDAIGLIQEQFTTADALRIDAADLLQRGEPTRAMEKLGHCFTAWHHAQQSVLQTAQLMRIDLNALEVDGAPLVSLIGDFTGQLRQIKTALMVITTTELETSLNRFNSLISVVK